MKKIIYLLIISITVLLLTNSVLADWQEFDQKEFKNSWTYAQKQIAKNKYVKNGQVDKDILKENIETFLKEKYQRAPKVANWKIRTAIRNEVNKLRSSKKTINYRAKVNNFLSKYKNKLGFFKNFNQITGGTIFVPKEILGCTNKNANNYNFKANKDDGSCKLNVLGCTDVSANNFNSLANTDDSSCTYDVLGCMDSEATLNNGECDYSTTGNSGGGGSSGGGSTPTNVPGCTDSTSLNFNSDANVDDDSCIAIVEGCTDSTSLNFNSNANTDDNSCIAVVEGCTDSTSLNFNSNANVDDDSCIAIVEGCTDSTSLNFNSDANTDDNSCIAIVEGCLDSSYLEYDANANTNNGNLCVTLIFEGCTNKNAFNYNPLANVEDNSCIAVVEGCLDSEANNYNLNANTNDNSCTYDVFGCTDSNANNYNENANVDDGSCEYLGCTDPLALNYDDKATLDGGSCEYKYPIHKNIWTTYFWIGEDASGENSWVSNHHSAWDEDWVNHYGGIDNPDCRNGYFPCEFTPKENPFYCALPYSDYDDQGPKENMQAVPWYEDYFPIEDDESIIKNRWIKIIFNGKEAYCQWEDAGPGSNDDTAYVFGNSNPVHDKQIGLDTSPAVRDYLGMDGMDQADWQFVDDLNVPNGPWTEIITSSETCWGSGCKEEVYESTLTEHKVNVNFNNKIKERKYLVYEPKECKTKECPLLIMFHGLGGNYNQAAGSNYNWQETADENEFIVAFPDSLFLEAKNYGPASDPAGKHWDITPLSFSATQDTQFVEEMISAVDEEYDLDQSKMFTTGHSYGGYFSYYINFVLNDQFKAFATHSAGLISYKYFFTFYWPAQPSSVSAKGNIPGMIIYSDGDNIAPKIYSDTLENQMNAKGHSPVIKQKSSITGHGWDISMNQVQWDFFMTHS